MRLWFDGALREASAVRIAPDDRGFTLGDGVFETLRVCNGRVMHASRHLDRLRNGAALLGIGVPEADHALLAALERTREGNAIRNGSLRLTLSRGPGRRGLATPDDARPTLLITAAGAAAGRPEPLRLLVARTVRRNEFSPASRIKSLSYLDGILARREAEAAGMDEALLLNTAGRVAEAATANLIVLLPDDRLWTPPVADGALGGIARGLLLERGAVRERSLAASELDDARALLLCNSLGVRAVCALDGRPVPLHPDLPERLDALLMR